MIDPMTVDRRAMIQRVLMLAGAGSAGAFSWPAFAAQTAASKPGLDSDAFLLLTSVADTIIPRTDTAGAVDAKVPTSFDALLTDWASKDRRLALVGALEEIDGLARKAHGKGFSQLDPQSRHDLLAGHEQQALKIDASKQRDAVTAMRGGPAFMNAAYGKLKDLIVLLYYLSEPALTTELSYVHSPGEWKSSIPVTPDTRPMGGSAF